VIQYQPIQYPHSPPTPCSHSHRLIYLWLAARRTPPPAAPPQALPLPGPQHPRAAKVPVAPFTASPGTAPRSRPGPGTADGEGLWAKESTKVLFVCIEQPQSVPFVVVLRSRPKVSQVTWDISRVLYSTSHLAPTPFPGVMD
jgi:hypothetical protein